LRREIYRAAEADSAPLRMKTVFVAPCRKSVLDLHHHSLRTAASIGSFRLLKNQLFLVKSSNGELGASDVDGQGVHWSSFTMYRTAGLIWVRRQDSHVQRLVLTGQGQSGEKRNVPEWDHTS